MKKIFSKAISILLTATFAAACITGCASNTTQPRASLQTPPSSEETKEAKETLKPCKLTFWHTYGDGEEEQLKNVVLPKWNALHPEVTIEPVRQDGGQFHQMIVTAFGTGQTPDVARIDIVNTASYAKQGGIVALDDMKGFGELKEGFLNAPMSTNFYKNKYYGLPLDTNCKSAVINQKTMKAIGLDKAPATMEEFITAVEKNGGGKFRLNVSGVGDWDLYPYFWLFGGELTDENFTKASGHLDSDASVKAIQIMIDLNKKKVLTIRDIDGSVDAWDGIKTGDYAMFFEGPWFFGSYEDTAAAGIIPATIPTYNGKSTSVVGGENIAIFESSKNKDAAYEFTKFMTAEETQLDMLVKGQIPVLKSLVNNKAVTDNTVWTVYMKQMESAKARIPSPNHTQIGEVWSDAMTNIFTNKADVKKELTKAATLIDKQLEG